MMRLLLACASILWSASPAASASDRVRLAGDPIHGGKRGTNEGRVEVLTPDGEWATICDDDWDVPAASIVCRQLGFPGALKAVHGGFYGAGSGKIALGEVVCRGREDSLFECDAIQRPNCRHSEDAGVVCFGSALMSPPPPPSPTPPPPKPPSPPGSPRPPAPPAAPPRPRAELPSRLWSVFEFGEELMAAHPWFSSLVIIAFGAAFAVAAACACVSVEVVNFKDQRRRIRFGCCWRMASQSTTPGGPDGGGVSSPRTPRPPPASLSSPAARLQKLMGSLTFQRENAAQELC